MTDQIATDANGILTDLTTGLDFNLPEVDLSGAEFQFPGGENNPLYQAVTKLAVSELTDGSIEGSGAFDALMRGFKAHLQEEFEKGRITGAEYAKAYTELTAAAMSQATQFVLGAEQTFWQAITGQLQGIAARAGIEVEKAKVLSARLEANNLKANYAITVVKLATEDKNYHIADYNLNQLMPQQLALAVEQTETARAQTMDTRTDGVTPIDGIAGADKVLKTKQGGLIDKQVGLVEEQTEAQRAQTMDTRLDGTTLVAGSIGKQKELHSQQIISYQRDAENKAARIFSDAFITMKTIDEGLQAPAGFTNASLDTVLTAIKINNNLD